MWLEAVYYTPSLGLSDQARITTGWSSFVRRGIITKRFSETLGSFMEKMKHVIQMTSRKFGRR
jgi:hypothetical protein